MRFAIDQTGEYVDAHTLSRRQIEPAAPFSCPQCGERVIVKRGAKRRLHFSHVQTCGSGESAGHRTDKWGVRQWLQAGGYDVEQEVDLNGRRADLVATKAGSSFVVEIQASPLAIDSYVERTRHYERNGLAVIWIASGLRLEPVPSFSPWMRYEIARRRTLIVPVKNALYRFVGCPISLRRAQGAWVPATSFDVSPFEPFYRFDAHRWIQLVRRKRMTPPYPTPLYRRLILNRLYPLGMLPSLLPTVCYLPLPALWGVHVHPFEFQTVLYLNRWEAPKDSLAFSIEKTCRQFNATPTSDFVSSFQLQWRQLLNVFGLSENVIDWQVPVTLEAALRDDIRLFQGFQRFMAKSYIN
ncbi:competence CoiA family protein [Exiguobacterium sp. SH31]|uniref:competence protein CoiA n=1 Tax=unclassified Exiguobacterium TaxID=2644629 RepID=UPI0008B02D49|nr:MULTISPECIES: competence protein CoiA family protein [unclassified Exiguobacterium]OGX78104.1 competence CoiA family protein [Exiguobacterium sp. SH31]TCI72045.1 competence CoiA family protein [Exiguobacterium sp. SH0S7]